MSKIKKLKRNNIGKKIGIATMSMVVMLPTITPTFVFAATGTTQTTSSGTTGGTFSGGTTDIQKRVWETGNAQLHFNGQNQIVELGGVTHNGEWYFNPRLGQTGTTTSGNSRVHTITSILIGNDNYDTKDNSGQGNSYHAAGDSRNPAVHNTGGASVSCGDLSRYAPGTHVKLVSYFDFTIGAGGTGTGGTELLETDYGTIANMPCSHTMAVSVNNGDWAVWYHANGEAHSLTKNEIAQIIDAIKEFANKDPKYAKMNANDLNKLFSDLQNNVANPDVDVLRSILHSKGFDTINSLSYTNSGKLTSTSTVTTYNGQTLTSEQANAVTNYENVKNSGDATAIKTAIDNLAKTGITDLTKLQTQTTTNQGTGTGTNTGTTTQTVSTTQSNVALGNIIKATQSMLGTSHTISDLVSTNTNTDTKVSTETKLNAGTTRTKQIEFNYTVKNSTSEKSPTFKHTDKSVGVCVLCGTQESIVDSLTNNQGKVIDSQKMLESEGGRILEFNAPIASIEDVKKHQEEIQSKIEAAEKMGSKNPFERQEILDEHNKVLKLYYLVGWDKSGNQLWVEAKSTWNNRLPENANLKTVILGQNKTVKKTTISLTKQSKEDLANVKNADSAIQPIINELIKAGISNPNNINDTVNKFINSITQTNVEHNVVDGGEKYTFNGKELTPEQLQLFKQLQSLQSNPLADKTQIQTIINQLKTTGIIDPKDIKLDVSSVPTVNKEALIKALENLKANAEKIRPLIPNNAYNNFINKLNSVLNLLHSNHIPEDKIIPLKNDLIELLTNTFSWSSEFKTDITLYVVEAEKIKSELQYNLQNHTNDNEDHNGQIHYQTVSDPDSQGEHRQQYDGDVQANLDADVAKFNQEYHDLASRLTNTQQNRQAVLDFLKGLWTQYHNDQPKIDEILNALKTSQGIDLDRLLSTNQQLLSAASSILGAIKESHLTGTQTGSTGQTHPGSMSVQQTPDVTKLQGAYFGDTSPEYAKQQQAINDAIAELQRTGKLTSLEGFTSSGHEQQHEDAHYSASGTVSGSQNGQDFTDTLHPNVQPVNVEHTTPNTVITQDYEVHSHISDDIDKLEKDWSGLKDAIQHLIASGGQTHQITKHLEGSGDITLVLNPDGTISSHFVDSTIKPTMDLRVIGSPTNAQTPTPQFNGHDLTPEQLKLFNDLKTEQAKPNPDSTVIQDLTTKLNTLGISNPSLITTSSTSTTTQTLPIFKVPGIDNKLYTKINNKVYEVINGSVDTTKEITDSNIINKLLPINESVTKTLSQADMDKLNDDTNKDGVVLQEVTDTRYLVGVKSQTNFKTNGNLNGRVKALNLNSNGHLQANYDMSDEGFSLEEIPEEITVMVTQQQPTLIKDIENILGKKISHLWYDDLSNQEVAKLIDSKLGANTVANLLAARTHEQTSDNKVLNDLINKLFEREKSQASEKFTLNKAQLVDIEKHSKSTKDFENNVLDIINKHEFNAKSGYISILGKYDDNCIKHTFIDTQVIKQFNQINNSARGSIEQDKSNLTWALWTAGAIISGLLVFKDKLRKLFIRNEK